MSANVKSCLLKVMSTTYQNNVTKLHVLTSSRNSLAVNQDHDVCLAVCEPGATQGAHH